MKRYVPIFEEFMENNKSEEKTFQFAATGPNEPELTIWYIVDNGDIKITDIMDPDGENIQVSKFQMREILKEIRKHEFGNKSHDDDFLSMKDKWKLD